MKTVLAVAVLLVFSFEVSAITLTVSGGGFDGIVGAKQFRDGSYDVSVGAASINTDHGAVSINARHITRTAVEGNGTIRERSYRGLCVRNPCRTPWRIRWAHKRAGPEWSTNVRTLRQLSGHHTENHWYGDIR
jgi:hypothetical protein